MPEGGRVNQREEGPHGDQDDYHFKGAFRSIGSAWKPDGVLFRLWGAVLHAMAGDDLPTIMEHALWKKLVPLGGT